MPINIPEALPAFSVLRNEGVMVLGEAEAERQDIRPLEIGLLNLMPKKISTETQFARLIGATPLQIKLTLIRMSEFKPKNTPTEHMEAFYQPFNKLKSHKFDGLIITGAPIEHLPFKDVTYWDEMLEILDWVDTHVHSVFGVCWGAMAMLWRWYGIEKKLLGKKAFGCFHHQNKYPSSPYLRGFSDQFIIPVSRWTEVDENDVINCSDLRVLLTSDETGPCLIEDLKRRALYIFNHFEYDTSTLAEEYIRDQQKGEPIDVPCNYFPENDSSLPPTNRWRSHGHLLYGNWINEIYQSTPFNLDRIGYETWRK